MRLNLPTWASTILGLGAGVLAVLNETVFGLSTEWHSYIAIALVFLAGLGISPLVGPAFRAAIHLSQGASVLISSALGALALAVSTLNIAEGVRGILQGVLVFAAALGFAPSTVTVEDRAGRAGFGGHI
jgi:hypothetical protein